jgi:hypothetical protein
MSVVGYKIKLLKRKDFTMKLLSYTAEKDNTLVSVTNRLMVSEYQINDLLDSLVSSGYTILTTEIGDGDNSQHWQG